MWLQVTKHSCQQDDDAISYLQIEDCCYSLAVKQMWSKSILIMSKKTEHTWGNIHSSHKAWNDGWMVVWWPLRELKSSTTKSWYKMTK